MSTHAKQHLSSPGRRGTLDQGLIPHIGSPQMIFRVSKTHNPDRGMSGLSAGSDALGCKHVGAGRDEEGLGQRARVGLFHLVI